MEAVSPPVTWKTPVRFPDEVPLTLCPTRLVVGLIPLWPSLITHCLYICLPYRRSWVRAPGEPCTWCSRSAVNTTISSVGSIKFSLFFLKKSLNDLLITWSFQSQLVSTLRVSSPCLLSHLCSIDRSLRVKWRTKSHTNGIRQYQWEIPGWCVKWIHWALIQVHSVCFTKWTDDNRVVQVLWRRKASVTVLYCYYGHYMLLNLGEIHLYIMQKAHLNLS